MDLKKIIHLFAITGQPGEVIPYGSGHIHDTFRVNTIEADAPAYLLQKINHSVFRDVKGMMKNISLVTRQLEEQIVKSTNDSEYRSLKLIPTKIGETYANVNGNYWRMYYFLDGFIAYDTLPSAALIEEAGHGFGRFLTMLADLPADKLVTTIPGFHDVSLRIKQLEEARAVAVKDDEEFYSLAMDMAQEMIALNAREVPLRITHNDTKSNNLLFDQSGKAVCVVDLDTVMPGKVWYDTGDSIRTLITEVAEDDEITPGMGIDPDRFEAYVRGYLTETREVLTDNEIGCIAMSGAYMAYIMGIRFLADYLRGDTYYKTSYPGQNLKRAANQLNLAKSILEIQPELEKRIAKTLQSGAEK